MSKCLTRFAQIDNPDGILNMTTLPVPDRYRVGRGGTPLVMVLLLLLPAATSGKEASEKEFQVAFSSTGKTPISYRFPLVEGAILRLTSDNGEDETLVYRRHTPSFLRELEKHQAAGFRALSVRYTFAELCEELIAPLATLCSVSKRQNATRSTVDDIEFAFHEGIRSGKLYIKDQHINSLGQSGEISVYKYRDDIIYDKSLCSTTCYINYKFGGDMSISVRMFVGKDEGEFRSVVGIVDRNILELMRRF